MAINLGSAYGKVSLDTKGFMTGINTAKGGINSLDLQGFIANNKPKQVSKRHADGSNENCFEEKCKRSASPNNPSLRN